MLFKNAIMPLVVLFTLVTTAQERTCLNGQVIAQTTKLEGIYILNKNSESETATIAEGRFTIDAKPGDTLVVARQGFDTRYTEVTEASFAGEFYISLETLDFRLAELVIVDYSHINSESLGLVPEGQKRYTPAERRVATASSFRMNPLGLDPFINAFSGRTTMLKNAAENDKKVALMDKIGYLYAEEDIIATLKVPAEMVQGFLFYAVENKHFVKAMEAENNQMAKFLLGALADKYNKLMAADDE